MSQYVKLEKKHVLGRRYYLTPDGKLPSVTTLLSERMGGQKKFILDRWRKKLGYEEARRQTQYAADVGSVMHCLLEGVEPPEVGEAEVELGTALYERMEAFLSQYDIEVVAKEPSLWIKTDSLGYAGSADLVARVNGRLCICDYKNSKKFKPEQQLEDYYLQGAAYCIAYEWVYGEAPEAFYCWLAPREAEGIQEAVLEGEKLQEWKDKLITKFSKGK